MVDLPESWAACLEGIPGGWCYFLAGLAVGISFAKRGR